LCVIEPGGLFGRVSSGWEAQLGWSPAELVWTRCIELLHPDDLDRTMDETVGLAESGSELVAYENRYRHKDGSYRWLAWNARKFDDGLIYAVARDVTESRAKSIALAISDERYRLLADLGLLALEQLDLQAVLDHAVAAPAET